MNALWAAVPVGLVCVLTLLGGMHGIRLARTTSDFYVASRAITPWWNASAIGGEYLSAASFLGVAGLVYVAGTDMLWYPVGYTLGYLVLLVLIAAPLRRSGAYTTPDFAEARLGSRRVRLLCTLLVVVIGWLYLLPQLYGAGLALRSATGAPTWLGGVIVSFVVTLNVIAGGMRSVTLVQAAQYWFKLFAIAAPALILLALWWGQGAPTPDLSGLQGEHPAPTPIRAYSTMSALTALCLGTMGLPHVIVRFYTNPDGRAARTTVVAVVGLLGLFYLFPPVYAFLGRAVMPRLPAGADPDAIVLLLPSLIAPGVLGHLLTGLLAAGAFAAFLSTASGLAVTMAGVIDQDLVRPRLLRLTGADFDGVHSFRVAAVLATVVPALFSPLIGSLGLATTVTLAFAVAASTFAPMIILGVWWRGLTPPGAAAGMVTGAALSLGAVAATMAGIVPTGWGQVLLAQPAAWSVPAAFVVTFIVSLATPTRVPPGTLATMVRLHTPEAVALRRLRP